MLDICKKLYLSYTIGKQYKYKYNTNTNTKHRRPVGSNVLLPLTTI